MPDTMTPRERVAAALRGEETDRTPIGLWRHFPNEDATPDDLVNATARFHNQFDVDLVKLMPTGMYPVLDYGVEVVPSADHIGTTRYKSGPVSDNSDWDSLPPASPDRGALKDQVDVVGRLRAALGPDMPILQTVFGPLTMAAKVAGGTDALRRLLEDDASKVHAAMDRFAEDVIAFGRACVDAGCDGFFFATQLANRIELSEDLYREHGVPHDLRVLEALRPGTWFTMLHLHGLEPLFDLADQYPIDAVNWHDRETAPSLAEALTQTTRCLVGGIERGGAIASADPATVDAEVRDAIDQTGGRRLIVAPGCVIPFAAPVENLQAARRAVEPAG
jgi:uroporphyrinogen decarboxylase